MVMAVTKNLLSNLLAVNFRDSEGVLLMDSQGNLSKKFNYPSMVPLYWLDNSNIVVIEELIEPIQHNPVISFVLDTTTGNIFEII